MSEGFTAIRTVLGAYRSTSAHVTEDQITAAWAEYEDLRKSLVDERHNRASAAKKAQEYAAKAEELAESLRRIRDGDMGQADMVAQAALRTYEGAAR